MPSTTRLVVISLRTDRFMSRHSKGEPEHKAGDQKDKYDTEYERQDWAVSFHGDWLDVFLF
jgi:hypothetical protein